MRKICTFNLPIDLVSEMNKTIRRGFRSDYVERAIDEKLKRKADFDLHDFKTSELLLHIRNTRFTKLTDLEKVLIDDMIDRLRELNE
tara:strand:+ start:399 stop:659 length:261 start_codon:yes stop_codon:yes gene_type:complete